MRLPTCSTECPGNPRDGLRGRAIVVGYDGSRAAQAAGRVAAALASARGAVPAVVHAMHPSLLPVGARASDIASADVPLGLDVEDGARSTIESEIEAWSGVGGWPVRVAVDAPAHLLAREAADRSAALIVVGLRERAPIGRPFRDETTLTLLRHHLRCPVLAVAPELTGPPRCVVVGMDFDAAARRAAVTALDLVAGGGTLVLAYVEPIPDPHTERTLYDDVAAYAVGEEAAFDRLTTELLPPHDVAVESVRVPYTGERSVAEELMAIAERRGAEVIAAGSRRHGWVDRVLLGSVTTDLVHRAHHSLLVVPPPATAGLTRLDVLRT